MRKFQVGDICIGEGFPLALIAGPCVMENEGEALLTARGLKEICSSLGVSFIFKSSYDKANRSSHHSFRGPGLKEGLSILKRIREEVGVPVLTDVHSVQEAEVVGLVCDIIQIPALLIRQTDLVMAVAKTGVAVNLKKGQYMAPDEMKNVIAKVLEMGNNRILLTDRGFCLGYHQLVNDMRVIPIFKEMGYPVCFDLSHSVQIPAGYGSFSGGERKFIPSLARASVAAGCDCLYLEVHLDPDRARCDGESSYPLNQVYELIKCVKRIYDVLQV